MSKAKAKKQSKQDQQQTLTVIAALKRGLAALEKLVDKSAKLEPGGYPVALTVAITGDVTVESPSGGGERQKLTVDEAGLAAGLLALLPTDADRDAQVREALKLVKKSATQKAAGNKLAASSAVIKAGLERHATELGLVETVPVPARAGAVKGNPGVAVTGRVGEHQVFVETGGVAA